MYAIRSYYASRLRYGLAERTRCDGVAEKEVDPAEIRAVLDDIRSQEVESVAVCLLHSYANPAGEAVVGEMAGELGIPVSLSHRILPEFREFERTSTTVVNAYVSPLMRNNFV